jgi:uncharacterized membrane protein
MNKIPQHMPLRIDFPPGVIEPLLEKETQVEEYILKDLAHFAGTSATGKKNFSESVIHFANSWPFVIMITCLLIGWLIINIKIWALL